MRYKDELRIAGVTALFCCAMLMITAVVPKDTTVAKARKTFKEAPETAADAEAQAQSEAEDAGFTVYTEDSNYDYEDMSIKDISESLNIPQGTIKSRLSRARKRLKEILSINEEVL